MIVSIAVVQEALYAITLVCRLKSPYIVKGGGTRKKVGGRNLITSMAAAGGVQVGVPASGVENWKKLLKK